jgi:hypothetical protein
MADERVTIYVVRINQEVDSHDSSRPVCATSNEDWAMAWVDRANKQDANWACFDYEPFVLDDPEKFPEASGEGGLSQEKTRKMILL